MPEEKKLSMCYAGVDSCGCITSVTVIDKSRPNDLLDFMRTCIERGHDIERIPTAEIRTRFGHKCGKPELSERIEPPAGVKLYRAVCEIEVLIAAEDDPSEYDIKDAATDEINDNNDSFRVCGRPSIVENLAEIPDRWAGTIPRGDAEIKCEHIVESYLQRVEQAALARPMPNQTPLPGFQEPVT